MNWNCFYIHPGGHGIYPGGHGIHPGGHGTCKAEVVLRVHIDPRCANLHKIGKWDFLFHNL